MKYTTQENLIIKNWIKNKLHRCPYCNCNTFIFASVPYIIKNEKDNDLLLLSIKCGDCAHVSFFSLYDILGGEWVCNKKTNKTEKENNIKQW